MDRKASAAWKGSLKEGNGTLTTESGVLSQTPYSFAKRFGGVPGTNPEELLAAAHAGCFTMALTAELSKSGITADKIETEARLTLEPDASGFTITKVHLTVQADIPGVDKNKFDSAVKAAEVGCPVSKLFKAAITVDAKLYSHSS